MAATAAPRQLPDSVPAQAAPQEIAAYIKDMSEALRQLTRRGRDLAFLDYLLAMVSEEAKHVASHQNH